VAAADARADAACWGIAEAAARAELAELKAALREWKHAGGDAAPCAPLPRVRRQRPLLSAAQLLECVFAALATGHTGRAETLLALAGRCCVDWRTLPDPDCSARGPVLRDAPPRPSPPVRCAGWLLRAGEWREWPLNSVLWAVDSGWLPPQALALLPFLLDFTPGGWGPGLALAGSRRVVELSEPLLPAVRLWVLAKSLLLWAARQPCGAGGPAPGRDGGLGGGASGCRGSEDGDRDTDLGLFELVELLEDAGHASHMQRVYLFSEWQSQHPLRGFYQQAHQMAEAFKLWVRCHPLRGVPGEAGGGGGAGGGWRDEESCGVPGSGCVSRVGRQHVMNSARSADDVCKVDPAMFDMPGHDAPAAARAAALRAAAAWLRGALTREETLCKAMLTIFGAWPADTTPAGAGDARAGSASAAGTRGGRGAGAGAPAAAAGDGAAGARQPFVGWLRPRRGWLPGSWGTAWLAPQEHWELLLAAAARRDVKTLALLSDIGKPFDNSASTAAAANALAAAAAAGALGLLPALLGPLVAAAEAERASGDELGCMQTSLLCAIQHARPLTAARDDAPIGEVVDAALLLLRAAEHAGGAEGERVLALNWLGPEAPLPPAFPPSAHLGLRAPAGAGGVVAARVKALLLRMWRDRLEAGEGGPPPPPPFGARWARQATFKLVANAGGGGDPDLMFAAVQWAQMLNEWRAAGAGRAGGGDTDGEDDAEGVDGA
jgi:hypothetical protein